MHRTPPVSGKQWSSKKLRECYEQGARAFSWTRRPSEPRRDGSWLVGQGMAACSMGCFRMPSDAQVRLRADGSAVIEAGFQDIGTGTLTIFPPDRQRCARAGARHGDLPDGKRIRELPITPEKIIS